MDGDDDGVDGEGTPAYGRIRRPDERRKGEHLLNKAEAENMWGKIDELFIQRRK